MTKKSHDPLSYAVLSDDSQRDENDYYPTPEDLIDKILSNKPYLKTLEQFYRLNTSLPFLDLGMGDGSWAYKLKLLFPKVKIHGIDIRDCSSSAYASSYDEIFTGNFIDYEFKNKYSIIGFNPPFYLLSDYKVRQPFLNKLGQISEGLTSFILPDSYLTGGWRYDNIWKDRLVSYCPFTSRIDFTGGGKPRHKHGMFTWISKGNYKPTINQEMAINFIDTR